VPSRLTDLDGRLNNILEELKASSGAGCNSRAFASYSVTRPEPDTLTLDELENSQPNPTERYVEQGHIPPADMMDRTGLVRSEWKNRFGLTNAILNTFLARYRLMQPTFPFVLLDDEWCAEQLAASQPLLLLAIVTVVTAAQPQLQALVTSEFQATIARRCVADGETSLESLQALLVHLAW
jgi:hypothetical protein